MATVNLGSVFDKIKKYSETPTGKRRMRDTINKMRREGRSVTGCGNELLTIPMMSALAQELIDSIKTTAASYDLAGSVLDHFNSLKYTVQDNGNGSYECYIYFTDDLSRESLETDEGQGEGIKNIIALFNNGYVASAPKYGWWNGHSPTGESLSRSLTGTENFAYIKGTQARPSLRFMQRAIEDFYNKYKGKYNLAVMLNDDEYDGNYAGSLNGIISKL